MKTEFEVRFINVKEENIRNLLKAKGGRLISEKYLMKRQTFDFNKEDIIAGEKKWIRVREEKGKTTLTLKHITDKTRVDGVKEIEVMVDSFENTIELIKNMGFKEGPYQENYREAWQIDRTISTIDTWPGLQPFLEIEGQNEEDVNNVASILGFNMSDGFFGSIDAIYEHQYKISSNDFNAIMRLDFANYLEILMN